MADIKQPATTDTYAPPSQHLDNWIRDLTAQLKAARAEAEEYEQSESQQAQFSERSTIYYDDTYFSHDNNRVTNYTASAPVASNSRQPAVSPSPYGPHPDAPPPPYSVHKDRLSLPIVLPQISMGFRGAFYSPFVRAYVPELEAHNISQSGFLTFIDGLNEAFVADPVFEGVGVTGAIMQQFYGVHPAQREGMGLQSAPGAASAATSYARTRAYVKAVNADVFHPNGLHVTILTTKKMMAKIGHPEERLRLPSLETTDELDESPLHRESSSSSATRMANEDARMRRIRALQGYVMPLDFDVPAVVAPDNLLKRMCASQAIRRARKQTKKDDKRRDKALEKREEKLDKANEKIAEIEKELAKERRKMEKEMRKSKARETSKERRKIEREFEKEERKLMEDLEKALRKLERKIEKHGGKEGEELLKLDRREEQTANKIRWVVITFWEGEDEDWDEDEDDDESTSGESSSGKRLD